MSLNTLSIDSALILQVEQLASLDASYYPQVITIGLEILEGKDILPQTKELSEHLGANPTKINKICLAVSTLLWECSKLAAKDVGTLQSVLLQLGLSEDVTTVFCKLFNESRRRILHLKGSLGLSTFSYQNLAWRLDVELSKRSLLVNSDPKFLLRLDLVNNADTNDATRTVSHHLEADYANMKLLQTELSKAVEEFNSTHCQRINRYIA